MTEGHKETNRDRVRRLLLAPLGFRFAKGVDEAEGKARLNAIADDVGHLTDDNLKALCRMMRVHGQGSARAFWPEKSTFIGMAHIVQPLPLVEDPDLLRWWSSDAGQRMVQEGTLVETYQFFERNRKPPVGDGPRAFVASAAKENQYQLLRIEERMDLGLAITAEDLAWHKWYCAKRDELVALVDQARAQRAARQSGAAA